ncbi:MAG: hypothetical protein FWC03_05565 [Treponema sp.]|nr:hypothetical protein [Treponema sp.]
MKTKQKLFLGFIVILMTCFILVGCATLPPVEFPSDFTGTWERVNLEYPHTLTFTSTTIKASNQSYYENLLSISGDWYTIYPNNNRNIRGTINLKLVGEYLNIIDAYDTPNAYTWYGGEDDWTGTWRRR